MTDCLADETIAAWADNALLPDERERAIEHVASCEVCRAVVGHLMMTSVHAPTPAKIGRYEIRGALGAGGMGVVLRGHDPVLGREVAIKMIKSTLVEPAHRHRMLREARAIAKVRHPNVVSVHELGEAGDELYVAMELVAGTMLQRWLGTPRPVEQRIALVLAIGRGLAAVHAAELLHRDIKPDNIVVRDDGTPVLVDFGLARDTAVPAFGAGSGIAGTPRYLAPEVASGRAATAASDQYQWWTIVEDALPDLRAVRPLVERGHDPDPARRFASMRDAVAALERAVATRPPRARWIVAGLGVLAVAGAI
ncbi:MAG TPA: protein kinase, partial [Kofleriaceae bacterium]|nr:protein kinase [Kofleriaceae bacterium]